MKNSIFAPVLLPTEDIIYPQKQLFKANDDGSLSLEKLKDYSGFDIVPQHLYLTSDAEIKSGDFFIQFNDIGTTPKYLYQKQIGSTIPGECVVYKVEFSTDPQCLLHGVPAIDGNTKATEICGVCKGYGHGDFIACPECNGTGGDEVNFLEEFCKRYNKKDNQEDVCKCKGRRDKDVCLDRCLICNKRVGDNQKVDVEKLAFDYAYQWRDGDVNIQDARQGGFEDGFRECQALQSQAAGGFSLDDVRKAILWAWDKNEDTQSIEDYLQSITQSQPKRDIVIELNDGKLIFK